jgi:MFS family permease
LAFPQLFRSLRVRNYRLWASGAIVSNVGTWMQRTAQDWIVLMQLTDRSATAVGIVMALQFGPQVLLLPVTGYVADHFDRRRVVIATQALLGTLAFALGLLTVTGLVRLWHVYVFAFLLGCVTAFDSPARLAFVSELVGEKDLSNAVALNSASFNGARLLGPALAGILISTIGTGWVFLANGASFVAVIFSLLRLDPRDLRQTKPRKRGGLIAGGRYVLTRPDLMVALAMLLVVGMFGLNFPIFISTMATTVFHKGAKEFGLLSSAMAVGSVTGALLAARRENPRTAVLVTGALGFGATVLVAALAPSYLVFALVLVGVGTASQTFTTTTNSVIQTTTDPDMRGRVMAIFLAIALGGTPLGAPLIGRIADTFGPRWAMGAGAAAGFVAGAMGLVYLSRKRK